MTQSIEEILIAHARENPERLPTLEMILDRLTLALPPALKSHCGILPDIATNGADYVSCFEATERLPSPCLVASAETAPWPGRIAVAVEPDLLFAMLEIMLGGGGRRPQAPAARNFTAIERGIGASLAGVVLSVLEECFAPIVETSFGAPSLETMPKALMLAQPNTPTVHLRLKVELDARSGHLSLILPYGIFDTVRGLLSRPFHGGRVEAGSGGWDGEVGKTLAQAGVTLTAVLARMTVPLSDVMEWRPGDVLDLGVSSEDAVTGCINGHPALAGTFGQRASGALALRVTERFLTTERGVTDVAQPD